ncbi:hypothetical protein ITP53_16725 [Nonomuraea sp. K274]|uniref:Uncharacterized protein n=1 Tax=Nonomuraea cypriaca TaxID=1187855 RepID=A0A931A6P4_9ACTN|nr:hypothetical protein [Nonomuraea cypriaca]MBF8187347.1 hypothetical protein [Nonomuraea cypriaca]
MATAERRRQAALIAVHTSWANTTDRAARTAAATAASPVSLDYWEAKLRAEGRVREEDIPAAAVNARAAEMRRRALKSADARRRNKTAKQDAARLAASA